MDRVRSNRIVTRGFILAELLIALLIIAEIATFTIPKILATSANSQNKSIAKEVAGMVSASFAAYQVKNGLSTSTKGSDNPVYELCQGEYWYCVRLYLERHSCNAQ